MSETRQRRLRTALDLAAKHLRSVAVDGLSSRALGDAINAAFRNEPATKDWLVTRTEIEAGLERDARFSTEEGLWRLAASQPLDIGASSAAVGLINPLRPGTELPTHEWQREALAAWRSAGKRGIIEAVTGSGKTRLAEIAIAQHLRTLGARAVIIVPTIELANQWLRSLHRAFSVPISIVGDGERGDFEQSVILIYVARSAADDLPARMRRLAASHAVLLVADECHRYGAEMYARALDAPFSSTLGLSATPERTHDEGMEQFVIPRLGHVVYQYGHDRGIAEAVIADFRVCFVGIDFAAPEQIEHGELSARLERARHALVVEFPFLQEARDFVAGVKLLADRDEDGLARNYLLVAGDRRRVVTGARGRHKVIAGLAESGVLARERILLFHETIADSEYLAQILIDAGIPAAAHHSELGRDVRRATLARFARGEISAIAAPRTLDEGVDVPDASLAIIVAGTSVKRQTIQRIGRVLRRAPSKRMAKILKIYVNGTGDDPTLPSAPKFARELAASPRAIVSGWPEQADDVLQFLSDDGRQTSAAT